MSGQKNAKSVKKNAKISKKLDIVFFVYIWCKIL